MDIGCDTMHAQESLRVQPPYGTCRSLALDFASAKTAPELSAQGDGASEPADIGCVRWLFRCLGGWRIQTKLTLAIKDGCSAAQGDGTSEPS